MRWPGLRSRIAAPYAALVGVAVLLPGAIAVLWGVETLSERAKETQLGVARLLAEHVGAVLSAKQGAVEGMARLEALRRMVPARIDEEITKIRLHHQDFTSLFVLDAQGKAASFVDRPWLVGRDLSVRDYFKAVRQDGRSYFSDSVLTVEKTITVIVSTPLLGERGELVGVLAGSFDVHHRNFNQLIVEARVGATGHAYLVDRRGILVAHPDTRRALAQEDLSRHEVVRRVMAGQQGVATYTFEGTEMLAAYVPVQPSGWGLVVQRPLAEARGPEVRLGIVVLSALLASSALAVLLGVILSRRIAARVSRLEASAATIGSGRLDEAVPDMGRDEIGALGRAVEAMRLRLAAEVEDRRRVEEALRASAERYRLLFASASDALFVLPVPAPDEPGTLIEVNAAACLLLGYTREELLRLSSVDFQDPPVPGDRAAIMAQLHATRHAAYQRVLVARDGRRIPVEATAHRFELDGRPAVLVAVREVGERGRAE